MKRTITEQIEGVRIDLRNIDKDMAGINPSLSLYKELEVREKALKLKLERLLAQRSGK